MRRMLLAGAVLGGAIATSPVLFTPVGASAAVARASCPGKSYVSGGCSVTITKTSTSITVQATAPGVTVTITISKGALPPGVTINVQPVGQTASVAKELAGSATTSTGAYVTAFTVNWTAPNGTSPTATAPITMSFSDPAIKTGDLVYELVGTKLTLVGRATGNGTATVTFSSDPTFIVMAPSRAGLASAHAPATPSSSRVPVRVSCLSGTLCAGNANLDVARKVHGKWVQKVVATGSFSIVAGQVGTANLNVTSFGKTVLARMPMFHHFYLGLVTQLSSGQRITKKVALK